MKSRFSKHLAERALKTPRLFVWGECAALGDGTRGVRSTPVVVRVRRSDEEPEQRCVALACGFGRSVAVTSTGDVFVWGTKLNSADDKQLELSPVELSDCRHLGVVQAAAGLRHVLLLTRSGEVFACGEASFGQTGNDCMEGFVLPPTMTSAHGSLVGRKVTQIACGYDHSVALCDDGTVHAWGQNDFRQCGFQSERLKRPKSQEQPQEEGEEVEEESEAHDVNPLDNNDSASVLTPHEVPVSSFLSPQERPWKIFAGCDHSGLITSPGRQVWIWGDDREPHRLQGVEESMGDVAEDAVFLANGDVAIISKQDRHLWIVNQADGKTSKLMDGRVASVGSGTGFGVAAHDERGIVCFGSAHPRLGIGHSRRAVSYNTEPEDETELVVTPPVLKDRVPLMLAVGPTHAMALVQDKT